MYHYVYRIEHIETGEFYIGSRSSKTHPTIDSYMGSMYTWKPDITKLKKEIIKDDFNSRDEANEFESIEIEINIECELNRNYHIPSKGFHTKGRVTVRDSNGKCFSISLEDERYKSGELKSACIGTQQNMVVVCDNDGNILKIKKDDERYTSGELKSILIGRKLKLNKRLDPSHCSKFTQVGCKNSQFGTIWIHNKELKLNKKIKATDEIPDDWELGRVQKNW